MHRWIVVCFLGTTAALVGGLTPAAHAQGGRAGQRPAQRGDVPPVGAVGVTPAEIQQMFDAYFLVQAQEVLQLGDEQYPPFITRLRALQAIRRRAENQRRQTINQLRRLIQPGEARVDEAMIKERLKALSDLDTRVAAEIRQAQDNLDEVLDFRQQARFRILEEEMERRKVELVMRTRQAKRPRPSYNSTVPSLWKSMRTSRARASIGAWLVVAGAASIAAAQAPLRRDAEQLKQKIAAINQRGAIPAGERVSTTVTEREVNAYLAFEAADELPTGVVDPSVSLLGPDRVTARAVVDLDQVRQQRSPTGLLDPMRYLRGRLMVKATGLVQVRDGVARLEFEAADIAGVPIPKFLLQQIVTHYSKSPARPSGISLDDPLALPARIREIQVKPGQAIVVQ